MDELAMVARRARRAAEIGKLRAALRFAPAAAAVVLVLALFAPARTLSAALAACVAITVVALRWWKRGLGAAATDGFVMGTPVALAGALTRACMPASGDWRCGIACVLVGVASAILGGVATAKDGRDGTASAVTAATASATAFAGCAGLGAGVAIAAALATAGAWAGVVAVRRGRAL